MLTTDAPRPGGIALRRGLAGWLPVLLRVGGWLGVAALAVVALGAWWGAGHYLLDLAGQFAIQAAFAAAALALAALVAGARRLALAAVAVVGFSGVATLPAAEPRLCPEGTADRRVVFANIWVHNYRVRERVLPFLRTAAGDVVVLSEVTPKAYAALGDLEDLYPYRTPCASSWHCGVVLLSRTPFEDLSPALDVPGDPPARLAARLAWPDGHQLVLAAVHLTQPWPFEAPADQPRQAAALALGLDRLPGLDLLVGDFNAVTWGAVIARIGAETGLAAVSSAGTWPAQLPVVARLPIDNALIGADIACALKTVGPAIGSDHRPITIDLKFR